MNRRGRTDSASLRHYEGVTWRIYQFVYVQDRDYLSPQSSSSVRRPPGLVRPQVALAGKEGPGTPYIGLFGKAPPERGTFFRLEVYKRQGFHELKYGKGLGKLSFSY